MTTSMHLCLRCYRPLFKLKTTFYSRTQLLHTVQGFHTHRLKSLPKQTNENENLLGGSLQRVFVTFTRSLYRNKCYHEHHPNIGISSELLLSCQKQSIHCRNNTHSNLLAATTLSATKHTQNGQDFNAFEKRRLKSNTIILSKNASDERGDIRVPGKENIYTVPNLLTFGRMLSAPFLGYMVMNEYFASALGLFAFAGISDLLDGFIARNFKNQNSFLGSAMDPMADKILVSVLTLTLTAVNLIPLPLTLLIVGRDVGLVAAAFYLRYISLPPPKTLSRYFDVSLVSAKLEPFTVSKWNTAFQLSLVAFTLAAPVFNFVDHPFLQGLWYVTGATTFVSGVQYVLFWKDSVKILRPENKK